MALIINNELKATLGDRVKDFEELFKDKNVVIELQENHIPKSRFDETLGQVKDYKSQVAERDKQLADLAPKAKGHEELTGQIKALQEANAKAAAEWEAKLAARERDYLLSDALRSQKARNPKAVSALLDHSKVIIKDGKLDGLDAQLAELRKTDPYLFDEVTPAPRQGGREIKQGEQGGQGGTKPVIDANDPIAIAMGLVKPAK